MASHYTPYERDNHDHTQFNRKSFWMWFIVWLILIMLLA